MKPHTQRRQYAGQDKRCPLPSPGQPQHFPSESAVVVLGVMYPSVLPREHRKRPVIANVAIARGLAGWCWSLAGEAPRVANHQGH